jgi:hypothetical protein
VHRFSGAGGGWKAPIVFLRFPLKSPAATLSAGLVLIVGYNMHGLIIASLLVKCLDIQFATVVIACVHGTGIVSNEVGNDGIGRIPRRA